MKTLQALADRTAVLFLGVAAGAAIGYSFAKGGEPERDVVVLQSDAAPSAPATKPTTPGDVANGTQPSAPPPPAMAAAEPTPLAPNPPPGEQILATVREGRSIRVGVFGDSFGDGVWSALYRLLPRSERYDVVKFSQQSTGFTRYKRLNLEAHDAGRLGNDPVDVAVISFGANDAQGVYADGRYGALLSPAWQEIIGARIDSYVAMLRRHGAMVYWVGLPKMRDAKFDADITGMNAFYADRMRRLGVPFIDVRPMTVDAEGRYSAYMTDEGTGAQKLLRANDGIHMSMNGYVRISKGLAGQIRAYVDQARQLAATPAAPTLETAQKVSSTS
ncbi:GDSL family lipase [Sphingomonas oleivorans]|uniref:GDSL family lipase n=2 Tax=Sphingomonas oleivorans TaxID=1735121 RepID=A0A2T5FYX1_9SPHN|nr:GDSL family lipase [Sphingomonas oleivorans]